MHTTGGDSRGSGEEGSGGELHAGNRYSTVLETNTTKSVSHFGI